MLVGFPCGLFLSMVYRNLNFLDGSHRSAKTMAERYKVRSLPNRISDQSAAITSPKDLRLNGHALLASTGDKLSAYRERTSIKSTTSLRCACIGKCLILAITTSACSFSISASSSSEPVFSASSNHDSTVQTMKLHTLLAADLFTRAIPRSCFNA